MYERERLKFLNEQGESKRVADPDAKDVRREEKLNKTVFTDHVELTLGEKAEKANEINQEVRGRGRRTRTKRNRKTNSRRRRTHRIESEGISKEEEKEIYCSSFRATKTPNRSNIPY
jgi:hypothetical protein